MSNPIRRLQFENTNVLPFLYEQVLRNGPESQERLFSSSSSPFGPQDSTTNVKTQSIEENPYFTKYAYKIKKVQATKIESLNLSENLHKTIESKTSDLVNDKEQAIKSRKVEKSIPLQESENSLGYIFNKFTEFTFD